MKLVNIHNSDRFIYLFCREDDGTLTVTKDDKYFPYYYELDDNGEYISYDGRKLKKIITQSPYDIRKQASSTAYAKDISYVKNYITDKVAEFEDCKYKICICDIENLCTEVPDVNKANDPVSCITCWNSFTGVATTWYLGDYLIAAGHTEEKYTKKALLECECQLLSDFVKYMKDNQFCIWSGWNFNSYDYPYLYNRVSKLLNMSLAKQMSPINQDRFGEGENIKYPAGCSIVDYMGLFRKVKGKEQSYKLDWILTKYTGSGKKNKKPDFSKLSSEIKGRNTEDVVRLVELEDQLQLFPYYNEIRRLTKCLWEDLPMKISYEKGRQQLISNNSKLIEMLLLQEAKDAGVVLPSKVNDNEHEQYEGAFRECYETGAFKNVGKYDLSSAYPFAMMNFCLDPTNIVSVPTDDSININGLNVIQNSKALTPTIVSKVVKLKFDIARERNLAKENNDKSKYSEMSMKYAAIKGIVNCFSGDTSIITPDGYKNIKDFKVGDKVVNVNPVTMLPEIDEVIATQKYFHSGSAYHFVSNKSDLIVTPDHRFLVESRETTSWEYGTPAFKTAEELSKTRLKCLDSIPSVKQPNFIKREETICFLKELISFNGEVWCAPPKSLVYGIRTSQIFNLKRSENTREGHARWRFCKATEITEEQIYNLLKEGWEVKGITSKKTKMTPLVFNKQDFYELLGWYVSEGYATAPKKFGHRSITICQKAYNEDYRVRIEALLNRLNLSYLKTAEGFQVTSHLLHKIITEACGEGSYNKVIPEYIMSEEYDFRNAFFAGLYLGDGDRDGARYSTVCEKLKNQTIALLSTLGYVGIRWVYENNYIYRITFSNIRISMFTGNITPIEYNDYVYCISTKNGTCYAGRNNNFVLAGQCAYGAFANRYFRLYSNEVASSTTFLVRDLLHYCMNKLTNDGIKVLYIDTDAIFCQDGTNLLDYLNSTIQEWGYDKYGKDHISIQFDYDGYYTKLLLVALCRYKGYIMKGNKVEEDITGMEIKRADSSKFMVDFQTKLVDLILDGVPRNDVVLWIASQKEYIKTLPLIDVAFPVRMKNDEDAYTALPIGVRAAQNSRTLHGYWPEQGDQFFYIPTKLRIKADNGKYMDVLAFDEDHCDFITPEIIDWNEVIEKNITKKIDKIFEAMKWKLPNNGFEYVELF